MKTHNLVQGSQEWLSFRASHYTASDAPAMLGISPHKSRDALLKEKATGLVPEADAFTQRRFAEGHRLEALARLDAEKIIGEELYPVTGTSDEHLKLSASFDGLTWEGDIAWEHKTLNAALRYEWDPENGQHLPEHYRAQMEQQLLVSGAKKVLFMASEQPEGGPLNSKYCWYVSDPTMRLRLTAGWEQFEADLQGWQPKEAAPKAIGHTPETLPALRIEVTGQVVASNLADFKAHALAVFGSINRDLQTDQDFADAEAAVKWCADVESKLKAAKQYALSQTSSIDELFRTIDDIAAEARRVRLELDKLVKAEKDARKTAKVLQARQSFDAHVRGLQAGLQGIVLQVDVPDFATAIKGLSSLASIDQKLTAALLEGKTRADAVCRHVAENLQKLQAHPQYALLFPDGKGLQDWAYKDAEALSALIDKRIAEHQAATQAGPAAQTAPVAPATPAAAAENAAAAQPQTPPALKLGDINERIAPLSITAEGLRQLGFEPAATQRRACLYHEAQWPAIRAALLGCINRH